MVEEGRNDKALGNEVGRRGYGGVVKGGGELAEKRNKSMVREHMGYSKAQHTTSQQVGETNQRRGRHRTTKWSKELRTSRKSQKGGLGIYKVPTLLGKP